MANTIKDPRIRRLATIGLLAVCALMLGRLVLSIAGVWGGAGDTSASPVPAASSAPAGASAARSAYPSTPGALETGANAADLHLDELARLNDRALPDFQRNPFQYGPTPEEVKAQKQAEELARNPQPPPPPPPPPVPFKAIGYQQAAAGQRVAYLCVSGTSGCAEDQEPYAVREGQEFGQHFKVLRITDSMVEVEDESYHQTVQLPFPQ
jgi:hypothetical protein